MTYRTIVADPPWHYEQAGGYSWRKGAPSGETRSMLAYSTMTVEGIAALPVADLVHEEGAHLYLWTTQRYLLDAHRVAEAWGFRQAKVLVWCKPPFGFSPGGAYGNACEFVIFARRGNISPIRRIPRDWFEWPRRGLRTGREGGAGKAGAPGHSAKPDAFLDVVEQVSPGPYIELFARRARFGWSYWGDESLGTAELGGEAA